MAIRSTIRSLIRPSHRLGDGRVIDLGGQASHTFEFEAPGALVYEYFADIPAMFKLLPDVISVTPFETDMYRVLVGASDHLGYTMAGIFDLKVEFHEGRSLRLAPCKEGPAIRMKGFTFPGDIWLEIAFDGDSYETIAKYTIDISLSILLPGPMLKLPRHMVQKMGERAMSFKISNMMNGFSRNVQTDFARFAHWSAPSDV
jgi:hypothetical protein